MTLCLPLSEDTLPGPGSGIVRGPWAGGIPGDKVGPFGGKGGPTKRTKSKRYIYSISFNKRSNYCLLSS